MTQQPGETRLNTATVVATLGLVVAILAAAVALAFAGWDGTAILGLLTALGGVGGVAVTLLDKLTNVHRVNVEQSTEIAAQGSEIATISRRVNGELDARIEAGAQRAAVAAAEAVLARVLNAPTAAYPTIQTATDSTRTGE